ncbi:hypothetical protein C1H46_011560 [Malus baccata]|uniref:Uncharacterized protein n=1 Tax=Malus baccata TaxID=106549 RepID=A0A540MVL7_MALBA|nr:hypothetical protein C1H46_011560 [Malus baccata]
MVITNREAPTRPDFSGEACVFWLRNGEQDVQTLRIEATSLSVRLTLVQRDTNGRTGTMIEVVLANKGTTSSFARCLG